MTTVQDTQEMPPPEVLVEPDGLLSEIANGQPPPFYETLVAELGDPQTVVSELGEREQVLSDMIAEFGRWWRSAYKDFEVWLKTWDGGDDGGQHRAEEKVS